MHHIVLVNLVSVKNPPRIRELYDVYLIIETYNVYVIFGGLIRVNLNRMKIKSKYFY